MGFRAVHWIQDNTDITGNEYLIALILALAVDDGNGSTIRRRSTLVADCHMSERALKYAMGELSRKGIVAVGKRTANNGLQISNAYVLRGYVEALGMTVEQSLRELSASLQELKTRPEQEPYDFSKNGKNNADNLPLFDPPEDDEVGGNPVPPRGTIQCPLGGNPVPPYINSYDLTLSLNSLSVADATDGAGTEEQLPFTDPLPAEETPLPFMEESSPPPVPASPPSPKKGKRKREASPAELALIERSKQVMALYVSLLGYEPANFGMEGKAAKNLARAGWTDDQITACFRSLKAEGFYSNRHLSLVVVNTHIAARVGTRGTDNASKGENHVDLNNGTAVNVPGRVSLPRTQDGGTPAVTREEVMALYAAAGISL